MPIRRQNTRFEACLRLGSRALFRLPPVLEGCFYGTKGPQPVNINREEGSAHERFDHRAGPSIGLGASRKATENKPTSGEQPDRRTRAGKPGSSHSSPRRAGMFINRASLPTKNMRWTWRGNHGILSSGGNE